MKTKRPQMDDDEKALWRDIATKAAEGACLGPRHPRPADCWARDPRKLAQTAAEIADYLVLEYRVRDEEGIPD